MAIHIADDRMTLETGERVVATARSTVDINARIERRQVLDGLVSRYRRAF
jgi:hypothetical protein